MKHIKQKIGGLILIFSFLFILQGCIGSQPTVELLETPKEPLTCRQILSMASEEVPDDDFILALERSKSGEQFESCWKPLMEKSLGENRAVPMNHLARAVHTFNKNETKGVFSEAVYQYLKGVLNGKRTYRAAQQKLMVEYLRFAIKEARSKHDSQLEKARLVCSRLDPDLYEKFFRR